MDQYQEASAPTQEPEQRAPTNKTLKDVMDRVEAAPALSKQRRSEILSGIRTFARCVGLEPSDIIAHPTSLRPKLRDTRYASAGVNRQRWQGVCSLVRTALRISGFAVMPGRRGGPLSPAWEELRRLAPDRRSGIGLSRFMSFCTAGCVEPDAVTVDVFAQFHLSLEENSFVRNARFVYRMTCVLWNNAAGSVIGWPKLQVDVPKADQRSYSLEWPSFPATFRADVESFLSNAANQDPLADDYAPSIRPATQNNRKKQIRQMASALVASGYSIEDLTDLAALVRADNAKCILKFFLDRAGGARKESIYGHAGLLRTIARHWVVKDEENIAKLEKFCRSLSSKKAGMTERNRERLRQFDDPRNVDQLLALPERLRRRAEREDLGNQRVLADMVYAVAIELLIVAPVRIKNLVELRLGSNIVQLQRGKQSTIHLVIPGEAVKNGVPVEMKLPKRSGDLLTTYTSKYRPHLANSPSQFLFPNPAGEQRNVVSFGRQISDVIRRHTGIEMHPHLFRHLAVKFMSEAHPEDIETPRRLLGHKSLRTTLRAYSEGKTEFAHKRFEAIIEAKRAQGLGRLSKHRGDAA